MRYHGLDVPTRESLARSLQGEALHALVCQLVEDQDVDFLRVLQAAQRFAVSAEKLESRHAHDRAHLNPKCLPMIDALGTLMNHPVYVVVQHPVAVRGQPTVRGALEARLRISPAMHTFVHDVVSETLGDLKKHQAASDPTQAIGATLVVMKALACAMNDVPLMRRIRGAGIHENLHTGEFVDGRDFPDTIGPSRMYMAPFAVAIAYNSVDAARDLIQHSPEELEHCMAHHRGDGVRKPIGIFEITPSGGIHSPEMLGILLDAFRSDGEGYSEDVKNWIVEVLLPKTISVHWPHLLDLVFDRRLEEMAPQLAVKLAATNAMPSVLEHLTNRMKFPALDRVSKNSAWFEVDHPLLWAMDLKNPQHHKQRASTVAVVIDEMVRRELQGDLFSAREESGHSVASRCVLMGWNVALVSLIDLGLDLDEKVNVNGFTRTLEAQASAAGSGDAEMILKSVRARREAASALGACCTASP